MGLGFRSWVKGSKVNGLGFRDLRLKAIAIAPWASLADVEPYASHSLNSFKAVLNLNSLKGCHRGLYIGFGVYNRFRVLKSLKAVF